MTETAVAAVVSDIHVQGPFKFLDYYVEADSARFAGREDDIAEVVARTTCESTMVLYGRSGLGKTSLLLAGVWPELRSRGFRPILIRVLENPLLDLRNAVASEIGLEVSADSTDWLDVLRATTAPAGCVLVFDQFEEFFVRQRHKMVERREFVQAMGRIVNDSGVRILFSLREDYLAEMDDLHEAVPHLFASTHRLRPLTAFGARQAIMAPLVSAGIQYDQRLLIRLVDLLAEFEFDSVLLQIACTELYREASRHGGQSHLTEAHLDNIGGLDGLFNRYLESAISHVPPRHILASRAILDGLITLEETKRAITIDALTQNEDFRASPEEILSVLACLETQRLVRRELRAGKVWYELSHERLVKSILAWFQHDYEFSRFREARDVVANATRSDGFRRDPDLLLSAAQILRLVETYRERLRLSAIQREFMFRSAAYRRTNVELWTEALGTDRCRDILLEMLESDRPEVRAGAAAASPAVQGVSAGCVNAALVDDDESVRRTAGAALAKCAGAAEIKALKRALWTRARVGRALAVLADFWEGGRSLSDFAFPWRIAGMLMGHQRVQKRHHSAITKRTVKGMVVGAIVGVAWFATIGVLAVSSILWLAAEVNWKAEVLVVCGYGAVLSLMLGVFGGLVAFVDASRAALKRTASWYRSAWPTLATIIGFLMMPLVFESKDEPFLVLMSLAFLGCSIVGLVGARKVVSDSSKWESVWWCALASFLPVLLMLASHRLVLAFAARYQTVDAFTLVMALKAGATLASYVTAVVCLTLRESNPAKPDAERDDLDRAQRRRHRLTLAAANVLLAGAFLGTMGTTAVPALAFWKGTHIKTGQSVTFDFDGLPLSASYFVLNETADSSRWVRIRRSEGAFLVGPGQPLSEGLDEAAVEYLVLPDKRATLFGVRTLEVRNPTVDIAPVADGNQAIVLNDNEWTPVVISLRLEEESRTATSSVWRAQWQGTLKQGTFISKTEVRAILPAWSDRLDLTQLKSGHPTEGRVEYALPVPNRMIRYTATLTRERGNRPELVRMPISAQGRFDLRFTLTARPPEDLPSPPIVEVPAILALWEPQLVDVVDTIIEQGEASGALLSALLNEQSDKGALHDLIGTRYATKVRYEEAIEHARLAVATNPNNPLYLTHLASGLLETKRPKEALTLARRAAELMRNEEVLDTLAHAEYYNEHWPETIAVWEELLKVAPKHCEGRGSDQLCDDNVYGDARAKAGLR